MTYVDRSFCNNIKPIFSEAARQRVIEHLKEAGIDFERIPKLIWPEGAISASQKDRYAPWEFRYKSDILREKKKGMERNLWWKREYKKTETRALYVWVFWCPGISGIFEGLWTYLVGIGSNYHGGGYKGQLEGHLLEKVMELFPLVDKPLFPDWRYYDQWQKQFIKRYPAKKKWCGKPQGKSPIWAEIRGDNIREILSRAQWPINQPPRRLSGAQNEITDKTADS